MQTKAVNAIGIIYTLIGAILIISPVAIGLTGYAISNKFIQQNSTLLGAVFLICGTSLIFIAKRAHSFISHRGITIRRSKQRDYFQKRAQPAHLR